MPKRPVKPEKLASFRPESGPPAELRQTLTKRKKSELVDFLMELAQADRGVLRRLTCRFDMASSPAELISATHQAIADATAFDVRDMNRNFSYDHAAYAAVQRNLVRLIASGQLRQALPLALELMKRGSLQVEMSDERLMAEEIEDCLNVVIAALRTSDLPASEVLAWCSSLLAHDRVGFIAHEPLESLRTHWQRITAR
jgi:murein L,D-transpeptidase YcbB/YkuD